VGSAVTGNVLLIDDNSAFCAMVERIAAAAGCRLATASSLAVARRLAAEDEFDLLLVDIDLPDGNGLDIVDEIDIAAHGRIVVVTGNPSLETAVRAVNSPVVDYLIKPVATDALTRLMHAARARALLQRPAAEPRLGGMIGESPPMQALFDQVRRVGPREVCVFVTGESGTGKELVARAVHDLSGRSGRFVALNCGAIAPDLLTSQLFGHERGAFTGAMQAHAGLFEQADGGTIFLDEITEMPATLQVYLLRVLETRALTRVGGTREIPFDVRVVAACNRDPRTAVAAGYLREDLYYRLGEFPIAVPPLRERREDIPALACHFLARLNERYGTTRRFTTASLRRLCELPWPGNVRELRHFVQRHYILADGDSIDVAAETVTRAYERDGSVRFSVGMTFEDVEREMLMRTLASCNNNKRKAARALGVTTKTIYNRLLRYSAQDGAAPAQRVAGAEARDGLEREGSNG